MCHIGSRAKKRSTQKKDAIISVMGNEVISTVYTEESRKNYSTEQTESTKLSNLKPEIAISRNSNSKTYLHPKTAMPSLAHQTTLWHQMLPHSHQHFPPL